MAEVEGGSRIIELWDLLRDTAAADLLRSVPAAALLLGVQAGGPTASPEEQRAARLLAMFEAVFLVAAADGELRAAEVKQLGLVLGELTGRALSPEEVAAMIDAFADALERDDYEARARQIARVLGEPGERRAAFAMAVGVSLLDGRVQPEEEDVFATMAQEMALSADEVRTIREKVTQHLRAKGTVK